MKKLKKIEGSCAVIALCYCAGVDEETALRICKACGFVEVDGMEDEEWQEAAGQMGIKFRRLSLEPMRLRKFITHHKDGLYLMGTFDHLFVVDNGIIVDPRHPTPPGLDRIIKTVWKVHK